MDAVVEISIVLLLIVVNGYFALAEMAIVSSRKTRLQHLAEDGNSRAALALDFAENPAMFLSTVQIGITLVGIGAGAFGGATLAAKLSEVLARIDWIAPYSTTLGFVLVVASITYLTLIVGELVPKHVALQDPEAWACRVAPPMAVLTRITAPVVAVLSASSRAVLSLLGIADRKGTPVSDEEVRLLFEEGVSAGVFEPQEQEIVQRLFRLSDRRVNALMTPRLDIVWLDIDDDAAQIANTFAERPHTTYPVCEGTIDRVLGVVLATDFARLACAPAPIDLRTLLRPPLVLHESVRALRALEQLKQHALHQALIVNEYGEVEGLVTLTDLLESLIGELPEMQEEPDIVRREDGSLLIDGQLPIDELKPLLDIEQFPEEEEARFNTIAGFIMTYRGHIPHIGETFSWNGYRFEIIDMDGNRIDRVLITEETETQ